MKHPWMAKELQNTGSLSNAKNKLSKYVSIRKEKSVKMKKDTPDVAEDKDDDDYHCVWYAGETVRTLEQRMDEDYPLILRKFGTTHQFQIAQVPDATEYCSSKFMCLFLESTVAGSLDAATNRTRRLTAEANGQLASSLPFWELTALKMRISLKRAR